MIALQSAKTEGNLLYSIYLWIRKGKVPVPEEGGVTPGKADSQALVQVSDIVRFLLPSVAGKS